MILIGAGEDLPIDGAEIVARDVGTVIEILDGEPVIRTAMPPRQEALDDLARHQLHVADPRQPLRIKVTLAHGSRLQGERPESAGWYGELSIDCWRTGRLTPAVRWLTSPSVPGPPGTVSRRCGRE